MRSALRQKSAKMKVILGVAKNKKTCARQSEDGLCEEKGENGSKQANNLA
jgi:hypothetical protein